MASAMALLDLQAGDALVAITLLTLPIAAVSFARSGPLWRNLGKGRFAIEQELPPPRNPAFPAPPVDPELQAEELRDEVRQLVIARNERRMRRGEQPLDVEAETERELADL